MSFGLFLAFCGLHLVVGSVQFVMVWVGGKATGFASALQGTPLGELTGGSFSNLNDISPFDAFSLAIDSMRFLLSLASFNYAILDGGGVVGLLGVLLRTVGSLVGAWVLFQFARAVAGSLGFGR